MYSNEEKTLILGALFHDIGKFQQRCVPISQREKHQLLSSGFVNKLFENDSLANIVLNHHNSDLKKSRLSGAIRMIAEVICEADNLASGERKPDLDVKNQQPLESIFTRINIKKDNCPLHFQTICDLYFNNYHFPINKTVFDLKDLESIYKEHWKTFIEEINTADKEEIETIFYILKKYLWCIPSSSYKTRSDVSLFEHSKITAAIAVAMYKFLMEKFKGTIEALKDFENREEFRYQLILADMTGIQNYIYNIGHKGAAKALKGRSFFLQQMLDNIAYYILDEKLNLPITNLIYSSGGKFYIFAPNTVTINKVIEETKRELELKFLNEYQGSLGIIIDKILLNGKDLEYNEQGKDHPISEKWDELNSFVEREKRRKLSNNWNYEFFEPSGIDGEIEKCAYTGKPLIKKEYLSNEKTLTAEVKLSDKSEVKFIKHSIDRNVFYQIPGTDDYITSEQFISQKIGGQLKSGVNSIIFNNQLIDYSILDINSFTLSNELTYQSKFDSKNSRQFLINDLDISKLKGNTNKGFKFYGGDWRFGDYYGEIVNKGVGIPRLGVLRLDVDNLGLIFKEGLGKHATFGRVVQLSSMLDFFFTHYLNKIKDFSWNPVEGLSDDKNKFEIIVQKLVEIVYSGGDDVFIVGHWSVLPDLALWINDEFQKFTCNNPNFSISAGISLFDDKYPIYKAAIEAGDYETIAKQKERKNRTIESEKTKNAICFLDETTPVSWTDLKQISNWVRKFYTWLDVGIKNSKNEDKKISKGLISRLYSIYYEFEQGKYKNWAKWRWRASYSLSRLARQYEDPFGKELRNFAAELFTSNNTEQELIQLLNIIANWTDLLTRKKEK